MRFQCSYRDDEVTIHVDQQVTDGSVLVFSTIRDCNNREFARKLFNVEGVTFVCFSKYEIRVLKGKLFRWNTVIAELLFILANNFAVDGIAVEQIAASDNEKIFNTTPAYPIQ
jgi:hypothetical protein